jgi:DNA-binding TFAR19-related protein (PDSD5 family)
MVTKTAQSTLKVFGPGAQEQQAEEKAQEQAQAKKSLATKQPSKRLHKVFMLTPEQAEQLDDYCYHRKTTIQATVLEGLDLVYRSKGLAPLKEEIPSKK